MAFNKEKLLFRLMERRYFASIKLLRLTNFFRPYLRLKRKESGRSANSPLISSSPKAPFTATCRASSGTVSSNKMR